MMKSERQPQPTSKQLRRRDFLVYGGAVAMGGQAALVQAGSMPGPAADRTRPPSPGDYLAFLSGPRTGELVHRDDVRPGAPPLQAWPVDPHAKTILDGARYNELLLIRSTQGGVVAFSPICTHAGCVVTVWKAREHHLFCPCHGSEYDPFKGGAVTNGPAPRPLPSLSIQDGRLLVIASRFNSPPGGTTSRSD